MATSTAPRSQSAVLLRLLILPFLITCFGFAIGGAQCSGEEDDIEVGEVIEIEETDLGIDGVDQRGIISVQVTTKPGPDIDYYITEIHNSGEHPDVFFVDETRYYMPGVETTSYGSISGVGVNTFWRIIAEAGTDETPIYCAQSFPLGGWQQRYVVAVLKTRETQLDIFFRPFGLANFKIASVTIKYLIRSYAFELRDFYHVPN